MYNKREIITSEREIHLWHLSKAILILTKWTHLSLVSYICVSIGLALDQVMACNLLGAKPLIEPTLDYG